MIRSQDLLPLTAAGNASEIRSYAAKFSSLSQPVANAVPNVLLWAVICNSRQRIELMNGQYGANDGTRRMLIDQLRQESMDLTTYTSQLRYRFPANLHEALARAQSE
jgi:nuclear pore complex protein Nup93